MKRFLAVQHTYSEFLGAIETQLEGRGIGFVYCRPFSGQSLPVSALQYDALWLLGGAYSVTDRTHCPWVDDELRLARAFRKARRPVIGLGFGGLLVAQALGAVLVPEPAQRARWTVAHRTAAGAGDPLAEAVHGRRVLVMVNGGARLPPAVPPLLVDDDGEWIAARDAECCAMLFRPEVKPGMIEDMIMEDGRPLPDEIADILAVARTEWPQTQRTTDAVLAALATVLDLMRERRKPPVFSIKAVDPGNKT